MAVTPYGRLEIKGVLRPPRESTGVYLAHHQLFGLVVAKSYLCSTVKELSTAATEAFLQARLNHKSICKALDLIVAEREMNGYELLLCMELLPSDLKREIQNRGNTHNYYTENQLLEFISTLTEVLEMAQIEVGTR